MLLMATVAAAQLQTPSWRATSVARTSQVESRLYRTGSGASLDSDVIEPDSLPFEEPSPGGFDVLGDEPQFLPAGDGSCCYPPNHAVAPRRFVFAEYLYWQPTNHQLDYAIVDDFGAAAVSGETARLEYEAQSGVRAGLGFQTASGWDLQFAYTGLESRDEQQTEGFLIATVSHPSFNVFATSAEATADLDYDVLDLEFGHRFLITEACRLRLHAGLRGARISQALDVRFDGGDFFAGHVARSHEFRGIGLRVGAEGTWLLCYGVGVFGRVGGSLLAGNLDTRAVESDALGLIVNVSDDADLIAPATEIALGLTWEGRHWQVQTGYELTSWYNLSNRLAFHDDLHVASFSRSQDVLGLHGLFARVGYAW
jgi:hypothetical protein